jgi:membrane protein YdbS with pleckstrin-like domain
MTESRTQHAAEWIYRGIWSVLVGWFRVPRDPPTLPVRPGEPIDSFRPAEGFLRYLKFWFWLVLLLTDLAFLAGWIAIFVASPLAGVLVTPLALFLIVAPDVVAYIAIRLRYDTTWYVMTDRSLRIRRGIMTIHEVTITFENVQNVSLRQGPLQRHYGIADLIVQTAGGGGGEGGHGGASSAGGHVGIIEGITNAEELRDRILARLRDSRSAGLGDESSHDHAEHAREPSWTAEHVEALREIRDELRGLAAS